MGSSEIVHELKQRLTNAATSLSSPFCCGGSFQPARSVRLACKAGKDDDDAQFRRRHDYTSDHDDTELFWMNFPPQDRFLLKLVDACKEASFGRGTNTVYDPTYRKSLELEPEAFLTNFELSHSTVLRRIKKVLAPKADFITAQLYKLNVYRPGDFFMPHVDTPRHKCFGSLVISLPTAFTGGELIIQHKERVHSFNWGQDNGMHNNKGIPYRKGKDHMIENMIEWAAFYSNCKHEVRTLTSGYRVTLTYNLYCDGELESSKLCNREDSAAERAEYELLERARTTETEKLVNVLCDAKNRYKGKKVTMGFPCSHKYHVLAHRNNRGHDIQELSRLLKGEDVVLFSAAKAAGLKPSLCRVWQPQDSYHYYDDVEHLPYAVDTRLNGIPDTPPYRFDYMAEQYLEEGLKFLGSTANNIEWCTRDFHWEVGGEWEVMGNSGSSEGLYCAIAILIDFEGDGKPAKPTNLHWVRREQL